MDSLTHIVIGACIGDLFLGKKIGKKAMLYGAIAASLPDIDVVATFWLSSTGDLLAHRGITHSILFAVVFVALAALFLGRRHRTEKVDHPAWLIFLGTAIASHLFLDAFNSYGIGWLEPFSHQRFSFNVIFVADPFFSIWPAVAALALVLLNRSNAKRRSWAIFGLVACSVYLGYCISNKYKIDRAMRFALAEKGIHYTRYFTTPCPFNNWLWYLVAETDDGFEIGYRSVFDGHQPIIFSNFPKSRELLKPFAAETQLHDLIIFSQGFYTADTSDQGLIFNDLRFGQIMGWQQAAAPFVFHYYLQHPELNELVVQRGRFANWNSKTLSIYVRRIRGIR